MPAPHPPLSNKLLRALSCSLKHEAVLLVYQNIRQERLSGLDRFSCPPLLKAAAKIAALNEGMEIHGVVVKLGFDKDPFCGKLLEARLVFDKMSYRDIVIWSIRISAFSWLIVLSNFIPVQLHCH